MAERPILFSGPMVLANLAGRKRQTRRVVNLRGVALAYFNSLSDPGLSGRVKELCPYGKPGDRLWVRETWRAAKSLDHLSPVEIAKRALDAGYEKPWAPVLYVADGVCRDWDKTWGEWGKTRVSIHMPRWASRLTLEVTGVDVDRGPLTQEQATAEGFNTPEEFIHLYEEINGKGSLDLWRWAISYRVVR